MAMTDAGQLACWRHGHGAAREWVSVAADAHATTRLHVMTKSHFEDLEQTNYHQIIQTNGYELETMPTC